MALTRDEAIDKAEEALAAGRAKANVATTATSADALGRIGAAYIELAKLAVTP